MGDLVQMEASYQTYIQNLPQWIPDGIIPIDIILLQRLGLLHQDMADTEHNRSINRHFHVLESPEKITLFNENFVIWIIPESKANNSNTLTLVAFNKKEGPQLELAYSASGIYNTSRLVLRVLEKLLAEIQENETTLQTLK